MPSAKNVKAPEKLHCNSCGHHSQKEMDTANHGRPLAGEDGGLIFIATIFVIN